MTWVMSKWSLICNLSEFVCTSLYHHVLSSPCVPHINFLIKQRLLVWFIPTICLFGSGYILTLQQTQLGCTWKQTETSEFCSLIKTLWFCFFTMENLGIVSHSKIDCMLFKCDFLFRAIALFRTLVQNRHVIVERSCWWLADSRPCGCVRKSGWTWWDGLCN